MSDKRIDERTASVNLIKGIPLPELMGRVKLQNAPELGSKKQLLEILNRTTPFDKGYIGIAPDNGIGHHNANGKSSGTPEGREVNDPRSQRRMKEDIAAKISVNQLSGNGNVG